MALALVCARSSPAAVSAGASEAQLKSLLAQLVGVYGGAAAAQGTVWHWAVGERRRQDGNVRYCGDNALLHAICSELQVRLHFNQVHFNQSIRKKLRPVLPISRPRHSRALCIRS